MIIEENQKCFILMAALYSAFLLSVTSIISKFTQVRVIYPVGIIIALIGMPFFFALAMNKKGSLLALRQKILVSVIWMNQLRHQIYIIS